MKRKELVGRWALTATLLTAACGGTTTQAPNSDKVPSHSEPAPEGAVSTGSGGTAGYESAHASAGTAILDASAGSPVATGQASASLVRDIGVPSTGIAPDAASCPGAPRATVFAEPANIVGMAIALTETDVYWNDGSGIVRQAKAGGPPQRVVSWTGAAARVAANAERLFWEADGNVLSTTIAAPSTGVVVAQHVLSGNWAIGGDQLYDLVDPLSGVGGSSGFDPNLPSSIEARPSSGDATSRVSASLTAAAALGPLTADATGAYWAYNPRNDLGAYAGGGGPSTAASSRIQKLTYVTGEVSDFASVGVIGAGNLQSNGDWVVWADADPRVASSTVYGSKPDGSLREPVGLADIVRGLAVYGSTVYWAASHVGDDNSDIWSAELGVKNSARRVACQIPYVYGLKADATDIYYFTWLAAPTINRIPKPAP